MEENEIFALDKHTKNPKKIVRGLTPIQKFVHSFTEYELKDVWVENLDWEKTGILAEGSTIRSKANEFMEKENIEDHSLWLYMQTIVNETHRIFADRHFQLDSSS